MSKWKAEGWKKRGSLVLDCVKFEMFQRNVYDDH